MPSTLGRHCEEPAFGDEAIPASPLGAPMPDPFSLPTIRALPGTKSLPDLPGLDDPPAGPTRAPGQADLPLRPSPLGADVGTPGAQEQLEALAMPAGMGSLPERIVWRWLETRGHSYQAQSDLMGGRVLAGGAVVDFIVYDLSPNPIVLRIQGDYWHGPAFPGRQAKDDQQYLRLVGQGYTVADLWESDIYLAALHDRLTPYILGEIDNAL